MHARNADWGLLLRYGSLLLIVPAMAWDFGRLALSFSAVRNMNGRVLALDLLPRLVDAYAASWPARGLRARCQGEARRDTTPGPRAPQGPCPCAGQRA